MRVYPKSRAAAGICLLIGGLCSSPLLLADDYDRLDQRLRVIESKLSRIEEGPGLPPESEGSNGMLGLVEDVQRLQEEVRQLRGDVERLQYEAEQGRVRQRDMFLDIEKRLAGLEQGRGSSAAPAVLPPGAEPQPGMQPGSPPGAPTVIRPPEDMHGSATTGDDDAVVTTVVNEQEEYLKAFEILKQARYDDSITAFQVFLQRFPDGNYADNARYWLAETYYVKKNYPASLEHFERLLAEHPDSTKLPGALLKIGYIQYEQGNNAEARMALERVRTEFSGSSVADLATQRLERMDREGR